MFKKWKKWKKLIHISILVTYTTYLSILKSFPNMKSFTTIIVGVIIPFIKYSILGGLLWGFVYTIFVCFRDFYNRMVRLENKMIDLINYIEKVEDDLHVSMSINASNFHQLFEQYKKKVDTILQKFHETQEISNTNNISNNEMITENFELLEKHVRIQLDKLKTHRMDIENMRYLLNHTQFQIDEIVKDMSPIKVIVGNNRLQQSLFVNKNVSSLNELYKSVGEQPFHFELSSFESLMNIKMIDLAILYKISLSMYTLVPNEEKNVVEQISSTYINFNPYESTIKSNVTKELLFGEETCKKVIESIIKIRPDIQFVWSGMNLSI